MSTTSLPSRVTQAKELLEEIPAEHDLEAEQLVNLQEAIEFLRRLEDSLHEERADD